jgi:hypothetical protein
MTAVQEKAGRRPSLLFTAIRIAILTWRKASKASPLYVRILADTESLAVLALCATKE